MFHIIDNRYDAQQLTISEADIFIENVTYLQIAKRTLVGIRPYRDDLDRIASGWRRRGGLTSGAAVSAPILLNRRRLFFGDLRKTFGERLLQLAFMSFDEAFELARSGVAVPAGYVLFHVLAGLLTAGTLLQAGLQMPERVTRQIREDVTAAHPATGRLLILLVLIVVVDLTREI